MSGGRSLTRHLLGWALGALALVWGSFIVVGYQTGRHEADELTDGHLASVATLLLAEHDGRFDPHSPAADLASHPELKNHDYQQSMSVVVWDASGRLLTRTGAAPTPPFNATEGFETLRLGSPPAGWRAFSRWDGNPHQGDHLEPWTLLAALGACTSITLEMYAQKKGWALGQLRVDLTFFKNKEGESRIERVLHVTEPLSEEQWARLIEVAGKTPVTKTLLAGAPITTTAG